MQGSSSLVGWAAKNNGATVFATENIVSLFFHKLDNKFPAPSNSVGAAFGFWSVF